jgi:hypothetical protein
MAVDVERIWLGFIFASLSSRPVLETYQRIENASIMYGKNKASDLEKPCFNVHYCVIQQTKGPGHKHRDYQFNRLRR